MNFKIQEGSINQIIIFALVCTGFLTPLDRLQRITLGNWHNINLSRITVLLILGLFIFKLIIYRPKFYWSALAIPLILYPLADVISMLAGVNKNYYGILSKTGYSLLVFAVMNTIQSMKQILRILYAFLCSYPYGSL